MVIQKNWKQQKVIPIEELKRQAEAADTARVSAGKEQAQERPSPPRATGLVIDFDWEYDQQDIYFHLEDVVNELVKEKKRAVAAAGSVSAASLRRAPRTRARQRNEVSTKTKIIIGALISALLISVYPVYRYYRSYQVEQVIKERERIRKYKAWQEKEIRRRERQEFEKVARNYITSAQDHLAELDKNEAEKFARTMYLKTKSLLTLAQQALEKELWEKAYNNANSSIMAAQKAHELAQDARKIEEERLEKERIAKAREAQKEKFNVLRGKFDNQSAKAASAIKEMENINANSYYPIPYNESRDNYQKGLNKFNELRQWSSTKGKDLDEVLQKRIDLIGEATKFMKTAKTKARHAQKLTKNKKIADQKEKLARTVEKQKQQAERMRKLKEQRLKIKRK